MLAHGHAVVLTRAVRCTPMLRCSKLDPVRTLSGARHTLGPSDRAGEVAVTAEMSDDTPGTTDGALDSCLCGSVASIVFQRAREKRIQTQLQVAWAGGAFHRCHYLIAVPASDCHLLQQSLDWFRAPFMLHHFRGAEKMLLQ